MHSPHSHGWESSSLLLSLPAPYPISLLSGKTTGRALQVSWAHWQHLGFVLEHSSSRSRHSCMHMALLGGRHAASIEHLSRTRQAHSKNYFYWKRLASTKE